MQQMFISYPREYRPSVERLVADLRSSGYDPYFDEHLAGGQRWWDELLDRIERSRAFVPIIGAGYLSSTPCQLEARYATSLGKPFLPIALEPTPPQLFPESIASAHWTDYDPERPGSILAVIRAINGLPPAPPLPAVMPARPEVPISYMTELQNEIAGESEMGRARQLALVADLKGRLEGADREAAVVLLGRIRQRPDVSYQAANEIDEILGNRQEPARRAEPPSPQPPRPSTWVPPQRPPQAFEQVGPPPAPVQVGSQSKPDNQLVWSILSTLCCNPGGVVAIVYSTRVDPLWKAGKFAEARAAATAALWWALISAPCAVVLWFFFLLVIDSLSTTTP